MPMPMLPRDQALKALALVRSQKIEESCAICDEVLASKPADEATLNAMQHVLRALGRRKSSSLRDIFWFPG